MERNNPAAFAFSVEPQVWQFWWFPLLCLCPVAGALVAAQRWYRARERQLSADRVQTMLDRYPGGVVMLSPDRRVQFVNDYVERVIGKSKEAMLGKMPEEAFGPVPAKLLAGVSRHGTISRIAFSKTAEEPPLFYDIRSFQLERTEWSGQGLCYFATDVTGQAKAEAARDALRKELEAAHERYRSFVENSSEAIWRLEFNPPVPLSLPEDEFLDACYERAIVAEANDNAGKAGKRPEAALAGRFYRDIRDKNDPVNLDRAWYRSGCQLRDYITVANGSDGRVITFMTNIYSVIENECLVRSWGIQREVTEKQRLQELIVNTARAVSAQTGKAFFDSLVQLLAKTLEACCAYVAEADDGETRTLAIWSDGRLLQPGEYSIEDTPCRRVVTNGQPYTVAAGAARMFPESAGLLSANIQSYAGTPLFDANGATVGLIAVLFKRPLQQPELVQSTLDIFAARASAEIQRLRADAELIRHQRQLRALAARNQNLVERERVHLAREIHDELGQQLTAIKIGIARIRQRVQRQSSGPSATLDDVNEVAELTDQTARSVRRLATQLRPPGLDTLGLAAAIRWHAKETATRLGIAIDCDVENVRAKPEIETAVFRLVQESLTNVARHAQASCAEIRLAVRGGKLELSVSDDGCGFDPAKPTDSLGLLGMHERAIAVGGGFSIRSATGGAGTTISAVIPFEPAAEAAPSGAL